MKIPTVVCRNRPPILVPFSQFRDELLTQPDELNDRPNGIQKHRGSRPRSLRKRACQGVENAAEIQGQGTAFG